MPGRDAPPAITGLSPSSGAASGGSVVTISGSGFAAGCTVTFAGVAATSVTVDDATSLRATTPAHAPGGPFDVVVTNLDGQSVTDAAAFTFL